MQTGRLIAAAAFVVTAFVAIPAAEAAIPNTVTETQSSVKNCRYYYHGYRRHYWHGRYYRAGYHCHRGWCHR